MAKLSGNLRMDNDMISYNDILVGNSNTTVHLTIIRLVTFR